MRLHSARIHALDPRGGPARSPLHFMIDVNHAHRELRDMLYRTLRLRPTPLLTGPGIAVPGATLWSGARTWVQHFRAAGLTPGDRVVLRAPRTPAHIMVTLAAWWEGLTLCPVAERDAADSTTLLHTFDAALLIDSTPGPHTLLPRRAGDAPSSVRIARRSGPKSTGVALIMTSSGSTCTPKRVALSYDNVVHQLATHRASLGMDRTARVLSVLPWHHAFGLLVDLWPALLSGASVVVDAHDGRSAQAVLSAMATGQISHLSMVPLQAATLAELPGGRDMLATLRGGVIGGAPIDSSLATVLTSTRCRAGYGQTEASPGIALGSPGEFFEGALGRPVGCETRLVDHELHVRGPNVCEGFWHDGALLRRRADHWLATGDLVEWRGASLRFLGRRDHRFKLATGRMVDTPHLERSLRKLCACPDVLVLPARGSCLTVVLIGADTRRPVPDPLRDLVAATLAHEGHRLADMHRLEASSLPRTPKGEPDRRLVVRALTGTHDMHDMHDIRAA